MLSPDAVLDFPGEQKRYLLEYETGSHTIVPTSRRKKGATLIKAERYGQFLCRVQPSPYERHFADGFAPELVFVTPREGRARNITAALTEAVERREVSSRLTWRACTVATFLGELGGALPPAKPNTRERAAEVSTAAVRFVNDVIVEINGARHQVRELNTTRGLQLKEPEYPKSLFELQAVLKRNASFTSRGNAHGNSPHNEGADR